MATALGDVLLDGKPYSLTPGGYSVAESIRTRPSPPAQPRTLSTFEHQNNWQYMGQSNWAGMGFPKYEGDVGTFLDCFGIDIGIEGELRVAPRLELEHSDATNPAGYVAFRIGYPVGHASYGHDRAVFVGKTNGKAMSKDTFTGVWTDTANPFGVGVKGVSRGFFNMTSFVGTSDGHIWLTDDGIAWTDKGTPGPTTDANILGVFQGFMFIGYSDGSIWKMDTGGGFTELVPAGSLGQRAVIGAGGGNVFYIITQGPAPQVLFTDGEKLYQATVIGTDFAPRACVFLGKLFIFGDQSFAAKPKGAAWVLGQNGISEDLTWGDGTVDQGIRTAQVEGEVILWSATGNATFGRSGIGVFDPRLDISPDVPLGYYVAGTFAYGADLRVHGLTEVVGFRYAGVEGQGVYRTTVPGTFKVRGGLFGADQRNIQKRWGSAEVRHTALAGGQTITIKTTKNPVDAEDTWGNSASSGSPISAPNGYKTPYLSVIASGDANGAALTIYDIALAYLRVPDVVKKEWRLTIAVEGSNVAHGTNTGQLQYGRDGLAASRTSVQMLADLNALWNQTIQFEDIDGTTHTVIVRGADARPSAGHIRSGEIDRHVTGGVVDNLSMPYTLHLIEL